ISRFCEPSSELHIAEQFYRKSALTDLMGIPDEDIYDNRLYRALDKLLEYKDDIQKHLKERLGELFHISYDILLYDVTSTYFEGEASNNPQAARGYSRDSRPDCKQVCIGLVVTKEDIATTIYQQFLTRFIQNIYEDEMGKALFHDYVTLVNVPIRVTMRLVQEGTASWFDNIRTTPIETRDDIIRQSMKEALNALREKLGDETKNWQWGNLHTLTLQHPFGLQKPLDKVFSIGPFPYGGGSTAMTSGEYSFNEALEPSEMGKPFGVTVGSSFRHIVDMSKPHEYRMVLPSGQSGQVFNKHYDDQTPLYLNGAYRTSRSDDESAANMKERLTLNPAR
ncbi:MAG: penicillin acylase family protein, partial [Bacteroidota bacterium]